MLGSHLSLLEVLHTPERAAAEEAGGGIFREGSQCSVLRKLPFTDIFLCSYFPESSLKNCKVSGPSKRETQVQVVRQKKDIQAVFPVVCSSWAHCSLSFLVYIFLTKYNWLMVGFFNPYPLHTRVPSLWKKNEVSKLLSSGRLTPLTDAFILLSLEGDEFDAGHLTLDCRI